MQSCGGFTVGLLWDCYGIAVGLLWVCYGIAMGLFYVGHIVAADAFPSAIVERTDKSLLLVRRSSVPHRF